MIVACSATYHRWSINGIRPYMVIYLAGSLCFQEVLRSVLFMGTVCSIELRIVQSNSSASCITKFGPEMWGSALPRLSLSKILSYQTVPNLNVHKDRHIVNLELGHCRALQRPTYQSGSNSGSEPKSSATLVRTGSDGFGISECPIPGRPTSVCPPLHTHDTTVAVLVKP